MKRRLFLLATSILILTSLLGANFAFATVELPSVVIDGQRYYAGEEIIPLRQENTKTFVMPNGNIGLDVYMGAIHYKDDYSNQYEQWKDIDTTIVNGRVDKAPYILTIDYDNYSVTVTSKKDGSVTTLQLDTLGVNTKPAKVLPLVANNRATFGGVAHDTDLVIEATNTRVRFKRVLKSPVASASILAKFNISQIGEGIAITCSGRSQATGKEIAVSFNKVGDTLIEWVDAKDLAGLVYPIEIDPTLDIDVVQSADDCWVEWTGAAWAIDVPKTTMLAGYANAATLKMGGGMRFQNVTILNAATITTAYFTLESDETRANAVVNTVIIGEDVDDAGIFTDIANYQARRGIVVGGANNNFITTASVDWLAIPGWTAGTSYDSPEIKDIIQEIVDRGGWASGQALVLFWDDHAANGTQVAGVYRIGGAWDHATRDAPKLHIEFTQPPSVTTNVAGGVEENDAILNGEVTAVNDTNIIERGFVWGTIDQGDPGDVDPIPPPIGWDSSWTEVGVWGAVGFTPHNIGGLAEGEAYYYRACAKNDDNRWAYGGVQKFLTKPDEPTNLVSNKISETRIDLTWVNGASVNLVNYLRREVGSYPVDGTDGTAAYTGALQLHSDTPLTGGQTYYYRIWSYAAEDGMTQWSDTYAEAAPPIALALVQQLYFQPNAIISGVTLPDRAAPAQDGTITWGTNPAGVTIYIGSLLVIPTGVPVGEVAIPDVAPPIAPPPGMFPGEEEMSGEALTWLHPTVDFLATTTNTPIVMFWWFGCALFILMAMAATHKYVQNLLLTGFSAIIAIGACVGMAFLPAWFIIIAILMVSAMVVMERSPSM